MSVAVPRAPWRPATAAGLALAIVFPLAVIVLGDMRPGVYPSPARTWLGVAVHWANVLALLAVVRWGEQRDAASFGWRPRGARSTGLGLGAALVMVLAMPLLGLVDQALAGPQDGRFVAWGWSLPWPLRVALVLTAGVFEELAFRGYAIERLGAWSGHRVGAGVATCVLFTLAHAPAYGLAHLLPVAGAGAMLTALYLWKRDLAANMVAHAAFDGFGLLLAPLIARAAAGHA